MTWFRDVKVEVVDVITGKVIPEWGRQTRVKDRTVSCFIQATTGRPFRLSVQAQMPFPAEMFTHKLVVGDHDKWDLKKRPWHPADYAPFHLLATLRFDGRFEKRSILYLSEAHPLYQNAVNMDGRFVEESDGTRYWHRWVFKEARSEFDLLFAELSFESSGQQIDREQQLVDAVKGLDISGTDKHTSNKAGVLEITFERVYQYKMPKLEQWEPDNGGAEEYTNDKATKDLSHKAATDKASKTKSDEYVECVEYETIPGDPYAIFQFKYRSEDVLRKHGFEGFPKKDTVVAPAELMAKVKLEEKGKKRPMGGEESDTEEDAIRAKKATTEINKVGRDGRLTKLKGDGCGGESDEEEMVTEKRAEMAPSALAAMTGVPALQKGYLNNISMGKNRTTDTMDDSFKHLDAGKDVRLAARHAIRSDCYDGDAEDSDDDDDEVKVDNKRQKMPFIFNKELREACQEEDDIL